jgi:hypothetical protein
MKWSNAEVRLEGYTKDHTAPLSLLRVPDNSAGDQFS